MGHHAEPNRKLLVSKTNKIDWKPRPPELNTYVCKNKGNTLGMYNSVQFVMSNSRELFQI